MTNKHPSLFSPFMLTEKIKLRNRIVMAPMTTWSANPDGTISEQELEFYKRRSQNVGLVITGCTYVTPSGIGFTHEFAAYDDRFINSLEKLAAAAKSGGAPAILQIFHAGNKAIPELVPNNDVISASASSVKSGDFMKRVVQSREMTENEIQETIRAFGDVTKRAIKAGFDGVELHGAHGFLLQNFFSPLFNQRNDRWGGDLEGRMRFPLAVLQEVKNVVYEYAPYTGCWYPSKKPGEYFFKGEELGELRDYYGNLLYTSIATENGVVLYQTASLNIIEDGPMIAYAAITETLT